MNVLGAVGWAFLFSAATWPGRLHLLVVLVMALTPAHLRGLDRLRRAGLTKPSERPIANR